MYLAASDARKSALGSSRRRWQGVSSGCDGWCCEEVRPQSAPHSSARKIARGEGIDGDLITRPLGGQDTRELDDPLRGAVCSQQRYGHESGRRDDVDNPPAALLHHLLASGLGAEEGAMQVSIDDTPFRLGEIGDELLDRDGGVVDQDIDLRKRSTVRSIRRWTSAAWVMSGHGTTTPFLLHRRGHVFERLPIARCDGHVAADLGERQSRLLPSPPLAPVMMAVRPSRLKIPRFIRRRLPVAVSAPTCILGPPRSPTPHP